MAKKKKKAEKPFPRFRWFSVILLYPDYATDDYGEDNFLAWVRVKRQGTLDSQLADAAAHARRQCLKANKGGPEFGDPPGSDLSVNRVFDGLVRCLAGTYNDL